jgi:hypothetical protein
MPTRDWEKELAKIDKQLESISDEALMPEPAPKGGKPAKGSARAEAGPAATRAEERRSTSTLGVMARLVLSVTLGVGMVFWPYPVRCGGGLVLYLAAVGVLIAAGVWSAVWTWRHRSAKAHVLSLLIILWGGVLGAREVLPRVGYAIPDEMHPAVWTCP